MKKRVSQKIIKTIPNKVFYEIWRLTEEEYKTKYTKAAMELYNPRWDIPLDYYMDLLDYIYDIANVSVEKIVDYSKMTKADFSYVMCVPIRTLENWYSGIRPCPGYVKLMMLRYLGMFKLPHHIYIEKEKPEAKEKKTNEIINDDVVADKFDSLTFWEQEHIHKESDETRKLLDSLKYLDRKRN